jgi:uroporphyrin-III C-methyltransferase
VVRLKGGDPFVLGRGGEELQACLRAEVPVRVVPGVSSAVAVPGVAGIPVTHRGLAHSYTVVSGHVPPSSEELRALVALNSTSVILMGIANLCQIATGLIRAGLDASTPAAAIERGFSDRERSIFANLAELPERVSRLDIQSPAVIVIGQVVRLAWLGQEASVSADLGSSAASSWPSA